MPFKKTIQNAKKSDFLKSVSVLMTGTILAQLIGYLLAPVITRYFSPSEMGEFGLFQRIVVLITTIATARYELAIPLPKKHSDSFLIFRLSIRIALITITISFAFLSFYYLSNNFELERLIWIICICTTSFALLFFNLGTNWSIRHQHFKKLTYSKITNSFVLNGSRVILGFFHTGKWGLIISFVISSIAASFYFIPDYLSQSKEKLSALSRKKTAVLAQIYKDFPLANLPHALSDSMRDLIIAVLLSTIFSEQLFGSFDHSYRMLRLPVMLIGVSMGQVFFNRISAYKNQYKPLFPLVKRMLFNLIILSVVPFGIIFFWGEELFAFVFGESWRFSGRLSEIMTPWLALNFITSPLSTLPLVLNRQRSFFVLGITLSIFQLIGFWYLPKIYGTNEAGIETVFQYVTWSQVVLSSIIALYLLWIAKKSDVSNQMNDIFKSK